jgi:hypothetical protein
VSWGSLLIGGGILIGGSGAAAFIRWRGLPLLYAFPGGDAVAAIGLWVPLLCTFPTGAVVAAIGTWLFATAEPRRADWQDRGLSIGLRVLGVATCLMQLYVTFVLAGASRLISFRLVSPRSFSTLCEATAVVWVVTASMTCLRAAVLAKQLGDRPGRVQACLIGMLTLGTLTWGAVYWNTLGGFARIAFLTAAGVASGWSVVFFVGFAVVLRRRARLASRPPAAATPMLATR